MTTPIRTRTVSAALGVAVLVSGCSKSNSKNAEETTGTTVITATPISTAESTEPGIGTDTGTAGETAATDTATVGRAVTLVTYDSFALTDMKFKAFTEKTGIAVKVLTSGDTGEMVNKAILTKDTPLGDVLWGVDNTFLDRALGEQLFEPTTIDTTSLDPALTASAPGKEVVPVDSGDVCVNYDKTALAKAGVKPPVSFDDLTKPEYKNMLVVQSPATSSPGLAFLLGTIAAATSTGNPDSWKTTWKKLKENGVLVVNGWSEAYETHFSAGGGGGDRPLVVSYGTSPAAAVLFGADPKASESPTGVAEGTCFRQVEYAGVLRNSKKQNEANALLAYLAGPDVQSDMQLNMFVYPTNTSVQVAAPLATFGVKPSSPNQLPAKTIAESRDAWIDEWTAIVQ